MSSSHLLIVPIITCVIIAAIIGGLALWVAISKVRRNNAAYRLDSGEYDQMIRYTQNVDDVVARLIGAIESAPATANTLLPEDLQQAIYGAHSQFRELRVMKGIR